MRKKCLETIYKVAKQDSRVLFIGSDLGPGVLDSMKKEMPERFFMEGISEQHIIGMSAGLAFDGFLPFVIDDYISLEQQLVQNGSHLILPYVFIIQENLPHQILSSMGLSNAQNISVEHFTMPIDMVLKTIFIQ